MGVYEIIRKILASMDPQDGLREELRAKLERYDAAPSFYFVFWPRNKHEPVGYVKVKANGNDPERANSIFNAACAGYNKKYSSCTWVYDEKTFMKLLERHPTLGSRCRKEVYVEETTC